MRKEALFGCLALAVAAGLVGPAAAGPITWSYQWEALGVPYQDPINGQPVGPGPGIEVWSGQSGGFGNASILFDPLNPAVWQSGTDSQSVVATRLNFDAVGKSDAWFTVGNPAPGDYTLTLRLRDDASGKTGQLAFHGLFSGAAAPGQLGHQFVGPTTGALDLGGHRYTVTVGPAALPQLPSVQVDPGSDETWSYKTTPEQAGEIDARVEVADSPSAPEPASLALAGVGLLGAAAARWRRSRRVSMSP